MDNASGRCEIDGIIRQCDKAFEKPVAERPVYAKLLDKIVHHAVVLYAHHDEVLGYCAVYVNDTEGRNAYITLLAVKPEYQGLHVGTDLLQAACDTAIAYGMQNCILEVSKYSPSAIRFYESNGFVFLSERESSFLIQKTLSAAGETSRQQ